MTATITKDEEELLIITDEEETTDELHLDISEKKEPEIETEVISFGEEGIKTEKKEEISSDIGTTELDFNFDLGGEEKDVTVEDMLGEKEEKINTSIDNNNNINSKTEKTKETSTDDIFNFDLEETEKVENKTEEKNISKEENEIELNFGEETNNENKISEIKDNIEIEEKKENKVELNFGEENHNEESQILDIETKSEDVKSENELNFSNSLNKTIEKEENKKNISEKKEKVEKNIINKEETEEKKLDNNSTSGQSDDTNTIINETIKKLNNRKKSIANLKKETLALIAELKEEIKALQAKVRKGNTEIKHQDKEMAKIDENIGLLRKMRI